MRPTALALALLLAGCSGSISFHREALMALVDDQAASYNRQAGLVNRACAAGAIPGDECAAAADAGKDAVKAYQDLRTKILTRDSVDQTAILNWVLLIAKAVAAAYGFPIPALPHAPNHPDVSRTPPLPYMYPN